MRVCKLYWPRTGKNTGVALFEYKIRTTVFYSEYP